MTDLTPPAISPQVIDTDGLHHIAIYLSGLKDGEGDLLPLGTCDPDQLWSVIKFLQGDVRYALPPSDMARLIKIHKAETPKQ